MGDRMEAYMKARITNSPAPGTSLTLATLPLEIQDTIIRHVRKRDILCLQRVSRHFHDRSSRKVWRKLQFVIWSQQSGLLSRIAAFKFVEALRTVATSGHNYAQYVREFELSTLAEEALERADPQLTYKYPAGGDAQRLLSINLFLLLRKADKLETFRWLVPIELDEACWQELGKMASLKNLGVQLNGREFNQMAFRQSGFIVVPPPPPPPPALVGTDMLRLASATKTPTRLSYHHIAGCSNLTWLFIKDLSDLDHLDDIASCLKASSGSIKRLRISFSSALAAKAMKPSTTTTNAPPPPPADIWDDDDDASTEEETVVLPPPTSMTQADTESVKKNKVLQGAALAKLLSVDTSTTDHAVDSALSKTAKSLNSSSMADDTKLAQDAHSIIDRVLLGSKDIESADLQVIEQLRLRIDEASSKHSPKRVKHNNKTAFKPKPGKKGFWGVPPPQPGTGPSSNVWGSSSSSPYVVPAGSTNTFMPAPPAYSGSPHSTNIFHNPYAHPGLPLHTTGSSSSTPFTVTAMPGMPGSGDDVLSWDDDMNAALGGLPPPPGGYPNSSSKKLGKLKAAQAQAMAAAAAAMPPPPLPSVSSSSSSSSATSTAKGSESSGTDPPIEVTSGPTDPTDSTDFDDMNVDMLHPEPDSDNSGDDAEPELESDVETTSVAHKGKSRAEAADDTMPLMPRSASPAKRSSDGTEVAKAGDLDKTELSSDATMREWIRQRHGLGLEFLDMYLVPVKASVLGRGIQLNCLQSITLLSVGGQGPFWQLMSKANEETPLPLKEVHTDDVSSAFLACVSKLKNIASLLLRRRAKKASDNTTTKDSATIEEIRRQAVQPHVGNIKVLVIQNDNDNSWWLTQNFIGMLCARATELQQLAFQAGHTRFSEFLQTYAVDHTTSLPKLTALSYLDSGSIAPPGNSVPPPGGVMANGEPYDPNHNLNQADGYRTCRQLLTSWARGRKLAGDTRLRYIAVRSHVTEILAPKQRKQDIPLWLKEEFEEAKLKSATKGKTSDGKTFEEWVQDMGYSHLLEKVDCEIKARRMVEMNHVKVFSRTVRSGTI